MVRNRGGIFVSRQLPRGADLFYDLKKYLCNLTVAEVFDVGANVGQSTDEYLKEFTGARIWCFEPSAEMFSLLKARYNKNSQIVCNKLALGNQIGSISLNMTDNSTMSYVEDALTELPYGVKSEGAETVSITTLDSYCEQWDVEHIDFLKIDTEGHDLAVLEGGRRMIHGACLDLVQCECSMSPDNKFHRPFESSEFLEPHGYRVFALYDQFAEAYPPLPNLRRVNAVFVSRHLL
ncbi:MAG: FkbM family methyltransferase [Rhodospirillales bacterium]|nr:FkbM family methyltransferase [Rhodospirillales bacterium]